MAVVSAKMVMVACIVLMAAISVAALTEAQIARVLFRSPPVPAPSEAVSAPQPSSSSSSVPSSGSPSSSVPSSGSPSSSVPSSGSPSSSVPSSGSPSQSPFLSISPSHAPASAHEATSSAVQNVAGVLGMVAATVLIMAMA